jgi:hypothetical protein
VQRGWYDRTPRRVRDLGCGGLRICMAPEIRRVACVGAAKIGPKSPTRIPEEPEKVAA